MAGTGYIETLVTGSSYAGVTFMITELCLKPKKVTGNYLTFEVSDNTGNVDGVIWEEPEKAHKKLKDGMVIKADGEIREYNGKKQIVVASYEIITKYDVSDFINSLPAAEIEEMKDFLTVLSEMIDNENYRIVWEEIVLNPTALSKRFFLCPGGKGRVHHNYLGGLAKHTTDMIKAGDKGFVTGKYKIDRELLLTGALIHDIGKVYSYKWDTHIEMTDQGRLMGHQSLGCCILQEIFSKHKKREFSNEFLNLTHISMSHHGETLSIIKPMTKEAILVSMLDSSDAMLDYAAMIEKSNEGPWSKYDYLTGRLYFFGKEES